jgi:cyclic beta-1,2-glucan synthetase
MTMREGRVLERVREIYEQWKFTGDEQQPIRAEFFPPDRLIQQARILALAQEIAPNARPKLELLKRIQKNSEFLHEVYKSVNTALNNGESIPPAEEWFVDNFHVIAEQLAGIKEDLPERFYRELPSLATGSLKGFPRIYEMALQLIAHTDSSLDADTLREYIRSYQTISDLTTGELWAIAILLRVGLIENLKRLILVSDRERGARKDAAKFAEKLLATESDEEIRTILREYNRDPRSLGGAFAVELILRLRDTPRAHLNAVNWLYDRLSKSGLDADELIRQKEQTLAAAQVSVSNVIHSLRLLATMDWSELVEEVSVVDEELRKDPSGYYAQCDFATRDRYRHVVEEIAKKSTTPERRVAEHAIELSTASQRDDSENLQKSHVGYYFIYRGRIELEKKCNFRPGVFLNLLRNLGAYPFLFYQGPILFLTVLFDSLIGLYTIRHTDIKEMILLSVISFLIPASALAVIVTNWFITLFVKPKVLPKLELKEGIPWEYRTFVVLPCLLLDRAEVKELLFRLEVTYLANSDDTLDFALLSDFADSDVQTTPSDENLLAEGESAVALLNEKYPRTEGPRFHLYHRKRQWNPSQKKWMGWERKRGKLEEFNRLLLGAKNTSYIRAEVPSDIHYVITLDADTILPRDSARKLVGTIAHPLNDPVIDRKRMRVVEGYGILQPRVSHTLTSANQSWFSRIYSGHAGIDPYTTAVSDIYQDVFREASYIGKGIYHLKAFSAVTDPRFPENRLLSHDLIEGAFARTALVSDIEIFDDHPSDYTSFILRLHRWVRGDWQVAPWILPRVPGSSGERVPNTLSWLNRWKLFDNLRRSLVSPSLFLALLLGWFVLPGSPLFWTLAVVSIFFAPMAVQLISSVLTAPEKAQLLGRIWGFAYDAGFNILQAVLQISFLASEAWVMIDAIVRTIFRMSRKTNMLEWTTAAHAEKFRGSNFYYYFLRMRGALLLSSIVFILEFVFKRNSLPVSLPILGLWLTAPLFAFVTGKPIVRKERRLSQSAISVFRSYARDTWRYFETFVGDSTNWLPPDNFQEIPEPFVAPRTSPTNIGFLLLSNIAAYDLGYIGAVEFVERTEQTLEILSQLKTFNGHLFNWYSTATLEPLTPRYVSTVDSGNLVSALVGLKQFSQRFGSNLSRSFEPRTGRYQGVRDTIQKFLQLLIKDSDLEKTNREKFSQIKVLLNSEPDDSAHQERLLRDLKKSLDGIVPEKNIDEELQWWWNASNRVIETHLADYERPQDIPSRLLAISQDCEALTTEIDFRFLFNESRGIFAIGFNVTNGQLDRSSYDLFASEARLTSFVAIAKGDVPQSHWFRMSRAMTSFGRRRILVSWSGSMFEYLMPLLFLPNEAKTLLDVTYSGAVEVQRLYGIEKGVPWGISEAAYNARDTSHNYQYGPFGVPELGLKRGLHRDLVIAPYATFLASMVQPAAAFKNLERLKSLGAYGKFGFYESLDFTKDRVPKGETFAIVRNFMAHHVGMSLIALDNVLNQDVIQKRFESDPAAQATSLLLQEKMPLAVRSGPMHVVDERPEFTRIAEPSIAREFHHPFVTPPRTQLLSNGNYLVMVSTGGGGFSEWQGIRLTRWREDITLDNWGAFLYVRDLQTNQFWSAGYLPTLKAPDDYKVIFAEDQVEIRRRDGALETQMEVLVSPEDNVEIRRVTLINFSEEAKDVELTSYLEIVLNTAAADLAHPAFSNLFVETEFVPEIKMLIASRRARASDEKLHWAGHLMVVEDSISGMMEYETDRARFIGRNKSTVRPRALTSTEPLSGTTGAVLDPIFSARCKIRIESFHRQIVSVVNLIGNSREEVIALGQKYANARAMHRAKELASVQANIRLNQLSIAREEADLFQRIAGRLFYSDLSLRARPAVISRNARTQSALWPYGISGDLPICLVRIEDASKLDIVRQMLRAHEYWRSKGFLVDLVILNEFPSSYFQELQEDLLALIRSGPSYQRIDVPGGIFLRRADLMPEEDQILLRTVARVQIVASRGSLARQVSRAESKDPLPQRHNPLSNFPIIDPPLTIPFPDLDFDNGFGGFTKDGKEYVIYGKDGMSTPAPWINVIANREFGFQISESGAGMTWSVNSHENRLTTWSNDAVSDPVDSAIYIRDEESGIFWSPTPQPSPAKGNYVVAHGAGYTRFNCGGYGLDQELLAFVHKDLPVKILKLRIRNPSRRSRTLSVTYFADLVLGFARSNSAHYVVTSIDPVTGALIATNTFNNEFAERQAFVWMNNKKRTVTGDRTMFIGPNGDLSRPAAMSYSQLSGKVGAGLDPCAGIQGQVQLGPLSVETVVILFGEGKDLAEVRNLVQKLENVESVERAYKDAYEYWEKTLGTIQVQTPDQSFDIVMNRWLLYQTYSCRFFSRSGFYQSSGAYGFRDQLQDTLAFIYSKPQISRDHLLLSASRQFLEGDVQHWWHPPSGRGVRTRSSDDMLWLPFCTMHYLQITGETSVLDELVTYLEAPTLAPDQMEAYLQPATSKNYGTLYEHCIRAIEHCMRAGSHDLPLILAGDWNDGMNRLGIQGKGESVWLAWFEISIFQRFAEICESRQDLSRAKNFRDYTKKLLTAIEKHAWDGEWYVRGFDDDGNPFGSNRNRECKIDSIAQTWAVLSQDPETERSRIAMRSVQKLLINSKEKLALLLTPPFSETGRDPGYIKGYPPGIRENGGHYNHAAAWMVATFAELNMPDQAMELFQFCNPLQRSSNFEQAHKYKVEPFAAVGDIYSHPMHIGRGGWSWYTGSAGWLYRAGLEWILGFQLRGDHFTIKPRIPKSWPGFQLTFKHGDAVYHITVENRGGTAEKSFELKKDPGIYELKF